MAPHLPEDINGFSGTRLTLNRFLENVSGQTFKNIFLKLPASSFIQEWTAPLKECSFRLQANGDRKHYMAGGFSRFLPRGSMARSALMENTLNY